MSLPRLAPATMSHANADKLDWTHEHCFAAYGVRFGLRTNAPQTLARARAHLPLGWEEIPNGEVDALYSLRLASTGASPDSSPRHFLYADSALIARDRDERRVLRAFEAHAQLLTALRARDYLFVHAGVVGWEEKAILVPGRSMSGKTMLVRALLQAGATYYSDEFAVLDRLGRVHPYAVPLSIRAADGEASKLPIEQLGGRRGNEPLPVRLVVMTQYQRRARWRPRTLSPSRAMLALMDNTVAARREPHETMPILRAAVLGAQVVQSKRGEAARIVPAVLKLVSGA